MYYPNNWIIFGDIIYNAFDLEDYDKVYKYIITSIEMDPHNSSLHNDLGFMFIKIGKIEAARTALEEAIRLDPQLAFAWNNLGYCDFLEHYYEKAMKNISKSLELDSSNSYACKNRALVHLAQNNKAEALTDLQTALEFGFTELYGNEVENLLEKHFHKDN